MVSFSPSFSVVEVTPSIAHAEGEVVVVAVGVCLACSASWSMCSIKEEIAV
mgnify:CR=1 FL=1